MISLSYTFFIAVSACAVNTVSSTTCKLKKLLFISMSFLMMQIYNKMLSTQKKSRIICLVFIVFILNVAFILYPTHQYMTDILQLEEVQA